MFVVELITPVLRVVQIKFVTQIYHPNVKKDTGEICAAMLGEWAPTLNLRYILSQVKQMMIEPNPGSPLEPEIAELFTRDRDAYNAKAAAATAEFAKC